MAGGRGRVLAVAVLLALPGPGRGSVGPARLRPGQVSAVKGLVLRLGEGVETRARDAQVTPARAAELSPADTERVLSRLPALAPLPDDEKDFALREKSLPPPRTGATVKEPFPPPQAAPSPPPAVAGPLTVVRRAPEGEIPLAPHLSVTFSQPMVAVTSHDDLAKAGVPVRLDPQPEGRWRWVGARTLLFEPASRFPMATEYRVEVPAGTRSATGGTLATAVRWTFGTPAPVLEMRHPADAPVRRQPVLFATFDQKIDPAAVLRTIQLRPAGVPLRLATPEELKADEDVTRMAAQATEGRWLAFVPASPLPPDAPVTVSVGPGTPSAEGPRRTAKAQEWSFRTFGALRVVEHRCGWNGQCPPGTPWQVQFSNPLDATAWKRDQVRVTPELPGLKASVSGQWLNISGRSKGRTTYRVTLSPEIRDAFGQTLGPAEALTFTVGSAQPMLTGRGGFVTLDPAAGPRFSVYSINHDALKVRAHAVTPQDFPAFARFMQGLWQDRNAQPPGRPVLNETVKVQGVADELTETRVDLSRALTRETGHVVLLVEPVKAPAGPRQPPPVVSWVQVTQIGLDAFADDERLLAWATSLRDGRPLEGVELQLQSVGLSARTGADGVAVFDLNGSGASVLVGRRGDDVALLPENLGWWSAAGGWRRTPRVPGFAWYVFDDRHMYRPGEEVKVKGWIRQVGPGPQGDVTALPETLRQVEYVARDSQGNEVTKGTRPLSAFGGFDLSLALPATMNLGTATLQLVLPGTPQVEQHHHAFEVQEFRRPEFEVTASASEGPHVVGEHADVTVAAAYFAGGALPDAELTWTVTQTPGVYQPPNRDGFTFGTWIPWWERAMWEPPPPTKVETYQARTDASGKHVLRIDFVELHEPRPTNLKAEATVMDVNRQGWTAGASLLVHPSALYVGLRSERLFVQRGETMRVDAIVTDIDGKAVVGRAFTVKAERLEWEQVEGEWKETTADVQDCAVTSKDDPVRCTFQAREGGAWRVTATVADDRQRRNQSQIRVWVAGGKLPAARQVEQEKVTLVPDKQEYKAGETAEVLVLSPFAPAEGLLTLRRSGLVRHERFTMSGGSHTVRVRIEEGFTPNVHLQVDLVGAAPRLRDDGEPDPKLAARPAFAAGSLDLSVPPLARALALAVTPREKELEPGGKTTLDVVLKDASGQPVAGGEVAVVVVDEAVLSLTGYRLADPIATFYARREAGVRDQHLRASILLARPEEALEAAPSAQGFVGGAPAELAMAAPAPPPPPARMKAGRGIAGIADAAAAPEPIRMRTDFAALALFAASVPTDANGRAEVPVTLPDNLTRYRVMAVAVTKANRFGKGESTLTARLPLMVRPSAPRFLNFGDTFELPVVVQNQTDAAMSVDVAVRASNAQLTAGAGRRLTVPARDRVEVRFPAAAARAGTARFQVGGVAGRFADAASFSLPVWTPATTEAFATYGHIDQGATTQPVAPPSDVVREFGGLEITTSSTALQALTDAVLYLVAYPFECSEQLASRVLAVAALKDVLTAFQAEGLPKPEEMIATVDRDLARLAALQNGDGGFPFWRRGDRSWPYVSIHVAHALERAQAKGFAVPAPMRERAQAYLKGIDGRIPKDYPADVRRSLQAYALYVRHRMNDRDPGRARAIVREVGVEKLPIESLGWLLPVLSGDKGSSAEVAAIRKHLANRATETASTATFAVDYGEQGPYLLLHSNRRTDAVLLEALIADEPKNDLIPKLVEGLLGHRRKGRWENTQENAFVLLALDRYFGTYEKVTPDFVARAWLGERQALEQEFRGRSTERRHVEVPMRVVTEMGPSPLVLAKEGAGRLYYRIGMRYAPSSLKLEPADHGFTVERRYEAVDDPAEVRRDPDGTWRVKAGARVRVRLSMVAESRRYHVALVDPLPAGLEALNPALAVTGAPPDEVQTVDVIGAPGIGGPGRPGHWWWWRRPWFEHQNLRDERVEAFASLLWEGVYTYSYVARATTPGSFVVPPTKAEEMYHPETFGRAASDRVVVE
jgi:alpha-2-macroglobulin